jgi:hypothetical protein
MGVKKFTFKEEWYTQAKAFLDEITGLPSINGVQLERLHQLSTLLGEPSRPGSCPTCNLRARNFLTAYVNNYERVIINGEEE